jgi:glycerol-3-phosphate dehydrogenase
MHPGETDRTLLSPERRRADRARLSEDVVDVLVIGGGVTGAGAALDAASRGLSVGLVEARDWAAGTSSRSSKLIHGGLRYLEQLAFPLVHEALSERSRLVQTIAPHLVRPLPFLLPLTAPVWQRAYFGAGVALYDVLGAAFTAGREMGGRAMGGRAFPRHRHLSHRKTLEAFPGLRGDVVRGSIRYWDAQVDDARHTLAVVRTAAGYGAAVLSSARVVGLLRDGDDPDAAVVGARVADLTDGSSFTVRARSVVAATGVWSDDVGAMLGTSAPSLKVRASKGVHLVVPRSAIDGARLSEAGGTQAGLILRTPTSVLFVIPWGERWIIGTTDTPWRLDRDHPAASSADIAYLLDRVNRVLARPIGAEDILGVYAGLRPLLAGESDETSRLSREHAVVTPVPGLVLVAGGKYTTYRVMAEDAVDAAVAGLPGVPPSRTARLPLVGAHRWEDVRDRAAELAAGNGVPEETVARLLRRHGDRVGDVLDLARADPALARPLAGAPGYLAAEVVHAVLAEGAMHLDDVLTRRTRVSIETAHRGVESAPEVARLMAGALGWDEERTTREVAHYTARVAAERESQRMPDDRTADAARLGAPDVRAAV